MKIFAVPKIYISDIVSSGSEDTFINNNNIISINNPSYKNKMDMDDHPFTRLNDNILVLYFHDIIDDRGDKDIKLFDENDASQIVNFINKIDNTKPLYVHCTAGVSRSGAVAQCLNDHINKLNNRPDWVEFNRRHERRIIPNILVKRILNEYLALNPIKNIC